MGTTPVEVGSGPPNPDSILIWNRSANSVFFGASDVTTETGVELLAGENLAVELTYQDNALYAVASSAGHRLDILRTGP